MNRYTVVKAAPILGQWRKVNEVLSMKPATAQFYLETGQVKKVEEKPKSTTRKNSKSGETK